MGQFQTATRETACLMDWHANSSTPTPGHITPADSFPSSFSSTTDHSICKTTNLGVDALIGNADAQPDATHPAFDLPLDLSAKLTTLTASRATQHPSDASHRDSEDADPQTRMAPLSPLPGKIANALVVVYEGLREFNLVENNRKVLACLIRFGVNLNRPEAVIFIKKSTIASKLNVNEVTVYRSLNALEQAGLIERDPQKRTAAHLQTIGYIRLTKLALSTLGLSRTSSLSARPVTDKADAAQTEQATKSEQGHQASTGLAPVQDVNSASSQSFSKNHPLRSPFEKIGDKTVPADLAWLHHDNQLALSGLFKLMRTAREKGARLSDVVRHAAEALRKLRGRELYAYLATLISLPIDHATKARDSREVEQREQERVHIRDEHNRVADALQALAGRGYLAPDGRVWTVESGAFFVTDRGRPMGSIPLAAAYPVAIDAARGILDGTWPRMGSAGAEAKRGMTTATNSGAMNTTTSICTGANETPANENCAKESRREGKSANDDRNDCTEISSTPSEVPTDRQHSTEISARQASIWQALGECVRHARRRPALG
ncbi:MULTISPECIES: hypothetical protein [unclassified Burkholderia]|uniref:hypothetical protein n=1 Tax=unclassified Burkholderia TaxID=2613784 RepID=UPI002AAF7134|nr:MULTISPECIES: hypothetical protein [unclassified Burkholderia]